MNKSDNNKIFGSRLRELRAMNNLQQEELAKKLGVHLQTISRYERGGITPGLDVLVRISELFNVSIDWLATQTSKTDINQFIKLRFIDNKDKYWLVDEQFINSFAYKASLAVFKVKNNNMFPALQKGDIILVDENYSEYSIDDIIIFNSGQEFCVKRIAGISKDSYKLACSDSTIGLINISHQEIAGYVCSLCRGGL